MSIYLLYVISLAFLGVLVWLYPGEAERIAAARGPTWQPVPDAAQLAEQVAFLGDAQAIEWLPEYSPVREPRSGVVRSYRLRHGEATYRLVVFRHDIACTVCRDVLAGAVFTEDGTIERVFVLDEWEVEGRAVDPTPLLAQLRGREMFRLGENVDGISGATYSSTGLVQQLNHARQWIGTRP